MAQVRKSFPIRQTFLQVGLALLATLTVGRQALANPEDDPFASENRATKAGMEPIKEGPNPFAGRIRFTARVAPEKAHPGEVVHLTITGTPLNNNHTYPLTQRTKAQLVKQLSKIDYGKADVFQPLWPVKETKPVLKDEAGKLILEHDKDFSWKQDIYIRPEATPGPKTLDFIIRLQACDANNCTKTETPYPPLTVTVEVLPGKKAVLSPELEKRLRAKQPEIEVVSPSAETGSQGKPEKGEDGLLALLGGAFIGAILMLLTPCVFPMIPITVNFFLKQSEKEHHRALPVASVYAITIIIMLTLVMVAFGKVIIDLATDAWFNLALGAAMVFFALSLFGMYEIELPRGLARFTSAHEGRGGYMGALFMALTFTITSFTCTGPFLGAMLGGAAALRPPFTHLVLAAFVYSATFAAPFFILALFPTLLKALPKSGGWLNAIKVSMGFVELALAMKFLGNADVTWSPGNPRLFTHDTVLCAWIALSFACGLYLIGVFRLPHDEVVEHVGVVRMLFAALFFGLTIYMTPALTGKTPLGVVGEKLVAFLPRDFAQDEKLKWHLDYMDAWKEAVNNKESGLIFIDFTGVTCVNCYENEKNVFPKPEVREELQKYVRVQLFTDSVPDPKLEKLEAEGQAKRNARWQASFGDVTNPFYVIFKPDKNQPLDKDGNLNGKVIATEKGKIFNVNHFVQFLKDPQKEAVQVTSAK